MGTDIEGWIYFWLVVARFLFIRKHGMTPNHIHEKSSSLDEHGGMEETLGTHKSKRGIAWKVGSTLGLSLLFLKTCDSLCDWMMDKRPSELIEVDQESSPKNLKNS